MKTKIIINTILITLLLSLMVNCSEDKLKEIEKLLERTNLVLYLPERFTYVPVIKNKQVKYNFAYKLENDIEVRYLIQPLDSSLMEYNAYLERKALGKTKNDSIVREVYTDPNNYHKSLFLAILFNIGKKDETSIAQAQKSISEFPLKGVQKEFNADFGLNAYCDLDPEFGQDYESCSLFMIHKKDIGDVYCFRMFKDKKLVEKLFKENSLTDEFYNLQFFKPIPPFIDYPKGKSRIVKF